MSTYSSSVDKSALLALCRCCVPAPRMEGRASQWERWVWEWERWDPGQKTRVPEWECLVLQRESWALWWEPPAVRPADTDALCPSCWVAMPLARCLSQSGLTQTPVGGWGVACDGGSALGLPARLPPGGVRGITPDAPLLHLMQLGPASNKISLIALVLVSMSSAAG